MERALFTVDAFTSTPFTGNPAAVCLLPEPAPEPWMRLLAREMNLSETAFLHPVEEGYSLRWLTPLVEVKLCGHATLAAAHVLWETGVLESRSAARFHTLSGLLTCTREGEWIEMDFPAKVCTPCAVPEGLERALGCPVLRCGNNGMDLLVEVENEGVLRGLSPDFAALGKLPVRGVIVTSGSASSEWDFVSRFFAPAAGVDEDPVTGSAHCALGPYWEAKTGRSDLRAFQASLRGGEVRLGVRGGRVLLRGQAVLMSRISLFH
jgi:PhzF family phenazine biosynthesis protein